MCCIHLLFRTLVPRLEFWNWTPSSSSLSQRVFLLFYVLMTHNVVFYSMEIFWCNCISPWILVCLFYLNIAWESRTRRGVQNNSLKTTLYLFSIAAPVAHSLHVITMLVNVRVDLLYCVLIMMKNKCWPERMGIGPQSTSTASLYYRCLADKPLTMCQVGGFCGLENAVFCLFSTRN